MKHARLDLARRAELLPVLDGTIAVFGPIALERVSGLNTGYLRCVSDMFTVNKALKSAGISVTRALDEACAHALVLLPRSKSEIWQLISAAIAAAPEGWIIVDGQKTDGIESVAKQITRLVSGVESHSKGHGKTLWFKGGNAQDLLQPVATAEKNKGGYLTSPGVFSADDVDPASELLMQHIPTSLSGHVADLGAGWGYLSDRALSENPSIETLHLVEDNAAALECARANVEDPRAAFHWADVLNWHQSKLLDAILMNPPFHTSRIAAPQIGINFVRAAACLLRPGGKLFLVANAHLPYETTIEQSFEKYDLLVRTNRFKVFCATRGRAKLG